jgi:hypothetical protein
MNGTGPLCIHRSSFIVRKEGVMIQCLVTCALLVALVLSAAGCGGTVENRVNLAPVTPRMPVFQGVSPGTVTPATPGDAGAK